MSSGAHSPRGCTGSSRRRAGSRTSRRSRSASSQPVGTAPMWVSVARRLLLAVPIGLGVTVICFGLVFLAPGDPLASLIPGDVSPADLAKMRQLYGFDKPIPVQYALWLGRAVTGDLRVSLQTRRPVLPAGNRPLRQPVGLPRRRRPPPV